MTSSETETTPLMKQYYRIKDQYEDCILLFRLGDFYEMFFEDAELASKLLEVTLTTKPVSKDTEVPMAGIPVHSVESYVDKLIEAGHRVAICEQVEEADESSGVVDREVIRVMTPGTLTEEDYLESRENNYLLSIDFHPGRSETGLAYVDLSTGEFQATQFSDNEEVSILSSELNRLHPSEILIPDDEEHRDSLDDLLEYRENAAVAGRPDWHFENEEAKQAIEDEFDTDVIDENEDRGKLLGAVGALIRYLDETQKQTLTHLDRPEYYEREAFMVLDATSQRNLELVESMTGEKKATLLGVLDETETAMGGRRMRQWILQPLLTEDLINERLDAVDWLTDNPGVIDAIEEQLKQVYDIQRIVGKIGSNRANPRDVKALGDSLNRVPELRNILPDDGMFSEMKERMSDFDELREELESGMVDDPPSKLSEGGIFKDGYSDELDEMRESMRGGKEWITELQQEERERTGIDSLKVGHNKVHGYYIEVTKANTDKVPDNYERRQTLTNSERYVTPELKEKEQVIFGAEEKSHALEEELFLDLRDRLVDELSGLKTNADVLAELDVVACLARLARQRGYVRPEVGWDNELHIKEGRHPVVEEIHEEEFVPNDLNLDDEDRMVILTGPNMSGKSTYIRQVALISIMAQMGSFVPADRAEIGMIDQVFTRVGAHDYLAGGKSTFMVEMTETADIVKNATDRSLLILDEVGRGTSTYDGLAIARAVVEYIADQIESRTLFATHYHELTQLADEFPQIKNLTVRAREWEDEIVFLRQVEEGASDRSYGIQVGKLAGLPESVVERARQILYDLEENGSTVKSSSDTSESQMDLFNPADQVRKTLETLDVEEMTPVEALNTLNRLQEMIEENETSNQSSQNGHAS